MSFASPKKRKYDPAPTDQEKIKKLKQDTQPRPTLDRKDKGKSRAADGEFTVVQSTLRLAIAPVFANNLKAGAEEMLDSMIMR
jgi:DNA-directed RNA polymerase I subunit RPA43